MPIKVILVEDSPVALAILKRILSSTPEIEVVGSASTGVEGLALLQQVTPDVICTDLHMPRMNGLEFTREVMATCPRPILVISASVQEEDNENVFNLLDAGAVDIFPKPRAGLAQDYEEIKHQLITKIKILSGVKVFTISRRDRSTASVTAAPTKDPQEKPYSQRIVAPQAPADHGTSDPRSPSHPQTTVLPLGRSAAKPRIVAIGASTGGPQALSQILSHLPHQFNIPIVCVQHISFGFLQGLIDWLNSHCVLTVKVAERGELPSARTIYFPPEDHHLEIDRQGRFRFSKEASFMGHRPSVNVTFNSLSEYYGARMLAILLTGMGRDGADGLLQVHQRGGLTIAQDESSCVVFGMPREAIIMGAAQEILPIDHIANSILQKL